MDVGADLGAGADRRPGVDHRPWADPGADVDESGHEHDSLGQERAVAGDTRGHDPDPVLGVVGLHGDLVEEVKPADLHRLDLAEPEVEENRLLRPFVHDPLSVARLGYARLTGVEQAHGLLDRLGIELAALPDLVDARRDVHHRASSPMEPERNRHSVS